MAQDERTPSQSSPVAALIEIDSRPVPASRVPSGRRVIRQRRMPLAPTALACASRSGPRHGPRGATAPEASPQ